MTILFVFFLPNERLELVDQLQSNEKKSRKNRATIAVKTGGQETSAKSKQSMILSLIRVLILIVPRESVNANS